jgi:hypothetical protein
MEDDIIGVIMNTKMLVTAIALTAILRVDSSILILT